MTGLRAEIAVALATAVAAAAILADWLPTGTSPWHAFVGRLDARNALLWRAAWPPLRRPAARRWGWAAVAFAAGSAATCLAPRAFEDALLALAELPEGWLRLSGA